MWFFTQPGESMDRKALARAWPDDTPDFDPTSDLLLLDSMWRERMQPAGAGNYAARQIAGKSTERQ
jgi:hypothetical protein